MREDDFEKQLRFTPCSVASCRSRMQQGKGFLYKVGDREYTLCAGCFDLAAQNLLIEIKVSRGGYTLCKLKDFQEHQRFIEEVENEIEIEARKKKRRK